LRADGAGLIPSDIDAESGLVSGLVADPHCNATHPVERFCDPRYQELCSLIQAIQAAARIESGMIEMVLPMDGRPGPSRCGVTREWADRSSRTTGASNSTNRPVGPDGHPQPRKWNLSVMICRVACRKSIPMQSRLRTSANRVEPSLRVEDSRDVGLPPVLVN
jgi:hypothetical protein